MRIISALFFTIFLSLSGTASADSLLNTVYVQNQSTADYVVCGGCRLGEKDIRAFHSALRPILDERKVNFEEDIVHFEQKNQLVMVTEKNIATTARIQFLIITREGKEMVGYGESEKAPFELKLDELIELAKQAVADAYTEKQTVAAK